MLGDPAPTVKPFNSWLHQWTPFTLVSDALGTAGADLVLYHQWHFVGSARSVLENKSTPEGSSKSHAISVRFGTVLPRPFRRVHLR